MEENGVEAEVILYLETPPSAAELKSLSKALGLNPLKFIRKGEAVYKDLQLADKTLDDDRLFEAMAAHPILIERPIVVDGAKAVLGRPPENILALLKD